jgi:hypothetical protein
MLIGHADAVDQATQRIAMKAPLTELTQAAQARQATSEFWAIGSPGWLVHKPLARRDATPPRRTKAIIYGLDGGPREVN